MKKMKSILAVLFISLYMSNVNAQNVSTNKDGLANKGYDLVNYFTSNSAERGSKEYSTVHGGATYYFINSDNLASFKAEPKKYLPQYDGFCAFAVAKLNQKVPVDPNTFRIDDGKLYLFFNDFWEGKPFNTIIPWVNNEAEMEKMAITNWKTLQSK